MINFPKLVHKRMMKNRDTKSYWQQLEMLLEEYWCFPFLGILLGWGWGWGEDLYDLDEDNICT